jgi:hypothetical protein
MKIEHVRSKTVEELTDHMNNLISHLEGKNEAQTYNQVVFDGKLWHGFITWWKKDD